MAYVDTSLLAAYYCPEPLSDRAQEALGRLDEPVISPLVEVELFSAVAAKVRGRHLGATAARQVLALFRKHLAEGYYGVVPIEAGEYRLACDWLGGLAGGLRALDALHLAAAFTHDLAILTADRALARAAERHGVACELFA